MKLKHTLALLVPIIILIITGAYSKEYATNRTLRVAFASNFDFQSHDPTNISFSREYIFWDNIYSTLIETSNTGRIEPGIAESFEWQDNVLKFDIRKNIQTKNGVPITTKDVVFSLKRLLVLTGNTHGNINDILCPNQILKSVDDECSGIRADENSVYLTTESRKAFLLPMLSTIDFAIIPRHSVDPISLKIVDHSETSGTYYVSKYTKNGPTELKLNIGHYHAAENIADKVILVPTEARGSQTSLNQIKSGLVDHITISDVVRANDLIPLVKNNSELDIHLTAHTLTTILVFTEKGRKELSIDERRYLSEKVKTVFQKKYLSVPSFESRDELFPKLSEGGLNDEQKALYKKAWDGNKIKPTKKIKIGLIKKATEEWSIPLKADLPDVETFYMPDVPDNIVKNLKDMPHAYITSTNTSSVENIGLISYSLNTGLFHIDKNQRTKWLNDYLSTDDKTVRINKLQNLHSHILNEFLAVPLVASNFAAVVRRPWKMEFSEFYAGNKFWQIKLQ